MPSLLYRLEMGPRPQVQCPKHTPDFDAGSEETEKLSVRSVAILSALLSAFVSDFAFAAWYNGMIQKRQRMKEKPANPEKPLFFIKSCVSRRRIFWTYHINMRMKGRFISRRMILDSVENYEIIESYPGDKYLPSYLVYAHHQGIIIHILFAVNVKEESVTVVTTYRPDTRHWEEDRKRRRKL
jgi:hypothetical protein